MQARERTDAPATDATLLPDRLDADSHRVRGDGVDLHVVTAGDQADPPVLLLHGFPDFWYGWREQIPALVDAGHRVVVPDQRGYNLSDTPRPVSAYRIERLVADAASLIAWTGRESLPVVGHDWGALVAWSLALRRPELVDRLGVVNVPHPTVFRETLRSNPRQLLRSWYGAALQLPRLPEWALSRNDCALLTRALESTSRPAAFSEAEHRRYRAAWQAPGTVRGMVNWYRAAVRHGLDTPRDRVLEPTLVVWGQQDDALLPETARASVDYCADGRLEQFPAASHWVHLEEPTAVSQRLVGHLAPSAD
ncbi:MAG: putative hydrolase or acyltransferases (alpha/beta hydrolase superfamily) [halophilic archaeon J07HB67]|jgi:Predicted hydrolases or acyltransferases (alpha/beta hydrolase superfamily)|nr:MAG: putative hydrolase or acyltransferases (alpha/beta hydrolase superfamily) [halophilic archaeon J07HB67]